MYICTHVYTIFSWPEELQHRRVRDASPGAGQKAMGAERRAQREL